MGFIFSKQCNKNLEDVFEDDLYYNSCIILCMDCYKKKCEVCYKTNFMNPKTYVPIFLDNLQVELIYEKPCHCKPVNLAKFVTDQLRLIK